jgi:type III pantothenate kinase
MLLAVDVGNTETVIGLFHDAGAPGGPGAPGEHGLAHHWRLSTVPNRTSDEHALVVTQLLELVGLSPREVVTGFALCSSVPGVTAQVRRMANRWFSDVPTTVLGPGTKTGMAIHYDNPKDVGADRIANSVGALDLFGAPAIVVDLGTATTFDVISPAGEYLGGAIAPGVAISLEALYSHAAALRSVELVEPRTVIGHSTIESIQSGVLYGYAAQVDGMVERISESVPSATVVATGGLASLIAPHTKSVAHVEPWLTLHGLRLIHIRNVAGDPS